VTFLGGRGGRKCCRHCGFLNILSGWTLLFGLDFEFCIVLATFVKTFNLGYTFSVGMYAVKPKDVTMISTPVSYLEGTDFNS
jgi:hypothetical protein